MLHGPSKQPCGLFLFPNSRCPYVAFAAVFRLVESVLVPLSFSIVMLTFLKSS